MEAVHNDVYLDIERFLSGEARLLDRRDYMAWFPLTTEDIIYSVTVSVARDAGVKPLEYAIIEEDRIALKSRVDQISNPKLTRAQNPPSMTRRIVSNIEAFHSDAAGEFVVISNLLAYHSRPDAPGGFYVAERHDLLRYSDDDSWRLARRSVKLDHTVLSDGTLSILL
jgi:3-phenylpropionate/trans-cinnamate dioxygenase beta subunit